MGMFDDLVPQQPKRNAAPAKSPASSGLFDDLIPGDGYDYEAVEAATAATPNLGDLVVDAPAVVAKPDFSNVTNGRALPVSAVSAQGQVPDYSSVFRDEEADNDGFGNIGLRALVGRAPELIGNLLELPANANEALTRSLGMTPSDTGIMGRMRGVLRSGADAVRELGFERDMAQAGYGEPTVTGGQVVEAVNPASGMGLGDRASTIGRFVPETLIASTPDMVATLNPLTLAGYMGARTNEIAETRAGNDERDEVNLGDLAVGGVAAPIEALLERFTTLRLLPQGTTLATPGVLPAMGRIAQELGLQGSLGGIEELVPYLGETVGTAQGATADGALEAFVGGAVAEGALGGTVQGGKEALSALRRPAATPEPQPGVVAPTAPGIAAELQAANAPQERPAPVLDTARIAEALGDLTDSPAPNADDLDAMLAKSGIAPEQLATLLGDLIEPAPSPASPAIEPSPAQAAAQSSPVRPETPPTREAAEPAAQIQTTGQPVQASAGQSAPVPAGADLADRPRGETVTPPSVAPAANLGDEAFYESGYAHVGRSPVAPPHHADREQVLSLRQEIGWSTRGGELVRATADASAMNEDERQGLVAAPKGEVIGRTTWIGQSAPTGGESTFWRDRPTKWTEQQANAAFDAFERGDKLTRQQQKIIDYAQGVADTYAQAEAEQAAELAAYDEMTHQRALRGLREQHAVDVDTADREGALSLYDLVHRAVLAGHPIESLDQPENESDGAYAARLWALSKEPRRGTDTRATQEDPRSGDQGRTGGTPPAEGLGDFALEQQPAATEPARAEEVAPQNLGDFALRAPEKSEAVEDDEARRTLAAKQTSLFGASETRRAADEQREAQSRNAPAPSVGGGLFAQRNTQSAQEPRREEAPAEPASEIAPPAPVIAVDTLDGQMGLMNRLADGTATLDEYRAGFAALQANRESILAELGKLKVDRLLVLNGMNARKSDGKDRLVRGAYNDLVTDYNLAGTLTWNMSQRIEDVIAARVAAATEQTLKDYAEKVAASRAERKARTDAATAGMENPQTIEDFTRIARSLGSEAKLTPEQRETFDRLRTEGRREQREADAKRNAVVRQVDTGATGMTLIETKHTQKGHDLFVVRMDERVERDVYDRLNIASKRLGGYYSSFKGNGAVPGFQFTTRDAAEQFMAVREGNVDASGQMEARAEAKAEARAESLGEKAARLREKAQEKLGRERKDNTARRAAMAASAEADARRDLATADTMGKIADAIDAGDAGLLAFVRHRTQVDLLDTLLRNAHDAHMRELGVNWEKAKEQPITRESLLDVKLPGFHLSRGDAVSVARRLVQARGGKQLGLDLAKQVDYGDEYGEAVKANPYKFVLSKSAADGSEKAFAFFDTKRAADAALARSADKVRGTVVKIPAENGKGAQWAVALAPDLAIERKLWAPDYDKKLNLSPTAAEKIINTLGITDRGDSTVPYWWVLHQERRAQLAKLGIETNYELREALRQYLALREAPTDEDRVRKLERALAGNKSVGVDFFPTPPAVVQRLIEQADIQPGMRVLEPSAGKGDVAEAVREAAEGVTVDTVEMSSSLREILEAKGFEAIGQDFLTADLSPVYDRIVMNPPFLNDNGAAHVRHAYSLLKPGGRLVAVMGNGSRGREAFDAWLEEVGGLAEPLPDGSFKSSFRPTGVSTQVVVIDKADGALESVEAESLESFGEPQELTDADLSEDERAAFARQSGGREAQLRAAVDAALGPVASKVKYLPDHKSLPERLRKGVESRLRQRGGSGQTSALFDPQTGDVYLFTNANPSPERAVFNVAHEIAGHQGLRALLGDALNPALDLALQNPTVAAVSEAIALERNIDASTDAGQRLAVEEALAELAAAVRTGNYDLIADRYGVDVPQGIRASVARAIENFLRRLKALFAKQGATFSDEDVRELLENAWQAAQGDAAVDGEPADSTAPDQTQTTEFRRWFGDSKVVDAGGKPLVVYHGTTRGGFDTFAENKRTRSGGFVFTSSREMALTYTPNDTDATPGPRSSKSGLYPVYLSIANPKVIDWGGDYFASESGVKTDDAIRQAREEGFDGLIVRNVNDPGGFAEMQQQRGKVTAGLDVTGDLYVAFSPEQIKSATANRGTFDPDSPSILESVAEPIPANATGRSVIADGRLLSLIDAAKAAGLDLSALKDAHAKNSASAFVQAVDDLLAQMRQKPRITGTKNAVTDAEREAAGRHPILREAVKSNEATVYAAMRALKDDPLAGPEAVARLSIAGAEGISLADEAVLLVYKTDLLNQREAAAKKLADPNASAEAKESARQAWDESEAKIAKIDEASINAGREWGRFGQFRQRMMREDFTLAALERKERARLERPLTPDESATIKAMADRIADLQSQLDKLQARVGNAESEGAYEALVKQLARPNKSRPTLESLRRAANDARARLKAAPSVPSRNRQSGAIMSPSLFADYAIIGAYHIANGAAKFADWVGAMRADLGDRFDRFKAEHPNIFRAAQQQLDKPLKADASVAEVLERIDPANLKPKDVRKLIEALVGEGMRGEQAVIKAAAEHLEIAEDEVRALFVQTERREPTLTEAQEELRDLKKLVRLQAEIDRLEAGEPKPPRGAPREDSPAVAERKAELAEVRKRLKPVRDPEGRYQELRGKQIEKRIAELQDRIARGDFATRPRVPRALSEANQRAMFELDKAKEDFLRHQFLESLKARNKWGKALGFVGDALNLSRAIMTSIDLSALFRQGGFVTFGHPIRAGRAFAETLPALFSENAEHRVMNEIKQRPNADLYRRHGLALTGIGTGTLNKIEEAYAARWLDKVALVEGQIIRNLARRVRNLALAPTRGSGRVYAAFLNQLRADSFDAMAATMTRTGVPTEAEAKWIAGFVNTATGRGKIPGKRDNAGEIVNMLAFAPRLVASRFSLVTGAPILAAPSGRAKKAAVAEYARFLTGTAVVMSLLAYGLDDEGDEEEFADHFTFDPRSSDFMKLRFGNTRIDPFTGLAQVSTFLAREVAGETVTAAGAVKPLRPKWTLTDLRRAFGEDIPAHKLDKDGKMPYGAKDNFDVIADFARSKMSPAAGASANLLTGSDFLGRPITLAGQAGEMVIPMSFGDIADVMEDQGVPRGAAMAAVGLLGMSLQVRKPTNAEQFADFVAEGKAVQADVKDRLAAMPVEQWPSALAAMKKEYWPMLAGVELDYYKQDGKYGEAGEPKRDADGKPKLESTRISSDYREAAGAKGGEQAHHLITDRLARRHPLMAHARSLGYDLDRDSNLLAMPEQAGDEIAHNTDHPDYDAEVFGALNAAEKRLKREHGSLDDAPADEVLDAIREVEDAMRDRIQRRDVPTKDGRLSALDRRDTATA